MNSETDVVNQPEAAPRIDPANRLPVRLLSSLDRPGAGCWPACSRWATIVLRKHTVDPDHLYGMTSHFVWLIPVADLCIFLIVGSVGWIVRLALAASRTLALARAPCAR